jgi:hypothetical protein
MAGSGPRDDTKERRHLHVRLREEGSSIYDLLTEYLQVAGKAPDWYWRTVGHLEGQEVDNMEELLTAAFEAGAYVAHEHPESLKFQWVTEEECERERKAEERAGGHEESGPRDRASLSHYA